MASASMDGPCVGRSPQTHVRAQAMPARASTHSWPRLGILVNPCPRADVIPTVGEGALGSFEAVSMTVETGQLNKRGLVSHPY